MRFMMKLGKVKFLEILAIILFKNFESTFQNAEDQV
jgi:hypothetical protein